MMTFLIVMGCIIGYLLIGILAVGAIIKIDEDMTIDDILNSEDNMKYALIGVAVMPLTVLMLFVVLFGKIFILCLKHVYKINQDDAERKVKVAKKEENEKKKIAEEEKKEKKRIAKADKITRFDLVDFDE